MTKSFVIAMTSLPVFFIPLLFAQQPPAPPIWTNPEGKALAGVFLRLEGETLVIRKEGKELKIPFAKLSLASRNQARALAENVKAGGEAAVADMPQGPNPFGKQADPEHERKLAESILMKDGRIEIWRGSGQISVSKSGEMPKGLIELKAVDAVGKAFTDEDAALLNGCKRLTRLVIHRANLAALPLASLPALELLEIYQSAVTPQALEGLRGSKALKDLKLWHLPGPFGGDPVPLLSTCPNLEHINLHKAGLTNVSLAPLAKLRSLRSLYLGGNGFSDSELAVLADIPALESLNLSECNLTGQSLAFLPKLKFARSLALSNCQFGAEIAGNVAKMPALTSLHLYGAGLTDDTLRPFGGNKTLRELFIDETMLTSAAFVGLTPIPALTSLYFSGSNARPDDSAAAALATAFPNLSDLRINAKLLGPAGYKSLGGLKKLDVLRLNNANLDQEAISAILELRALRTLSLNGSSVSNELLLMFDPVKSKLVAIDLENTRIDDQSVEFLSKFRMLATLSIRGTDITKDGAEKLRKALPGCDIAH